MNYFKTLIFCTFLIFVLKNMCLADDKPYAEKDLKSGSYFSKKETRDIEKDDFANPGMIWVERGEEIFKFAEGTRNISCLTCHNSSSLALDDAATKYPKIDKTVGRLINLEQKINLCRQNQMDAERFAFESKSLLSLSTYISYLSRGKPMNVNIDGKANKYFIRGKELYFKRIGQMNLACNQCHDELSGSYLRSEKISQGHINGFPAYLMRWDSVASVHKRFQFCNNQARAEPLSIGHIDYNALQLYIAWRGNSLLIESPSVRR